MSKNFDIKAEVIRSKGIFASETLPQIKYTFTVTNTGNVTLTNIRITDDKVGDLSCSSSLAPGAKTTCTGTYQTTSSDLQAGKVKNIATVYGISPIGEVSATGTTETILQSGSLTLTKIASPTTFTRVGDVITYTFDVTNTGNVTLNNVTINDPLLTNINCTQTSLAPGATTTCTATYTVKESDITAGEIVNSATVSGLGPTGTVTSEAASATVTLTLSPQITLTKTAEPTTFTKVGDVITYTYTVTNSGNVAINSVYVTDNKINGKLCQSSMLAVGETKTCEFAYTITQADVTAGRVTNTATASGCSVNGCTPVTSEPVSATVTLNSTPALTIEKSASPSSYNTVDEKITYTFKLTNTGNVRIENILITDSKISRDQIKCEPISLEPGESDTCLSTYLVTQTDIDNGSITNTASATGKDSLGRDITSNTSSVTSFAQLSPGISLNKSGTVL